MIAALLNSQQTAKRAAAAFKKAHDEHAAAHIPKIYASGQREEANIIVGLRAAVATLSARVEREDAAEDYYAAGADPEGLP